MTTVIDNIWRTGDVGEPGYSVRGQDLPSCTYSGSQDYWSGATQGSLADLLPTCYITESVYAFLTDAEIESVRSKILGIYPDSYAYKYQECPPGDKCYYCWDFIPDVTSRPLPSNEPSPPPGDKDIFGLIMDNSSLIIVGAFVGAIVLTSMQPIGD